MKRVAGSVALALAVALAGCASSPDPIEPPAALTEYKSALDIEPVWQAEVDRGAAGQYLKFAPSHDGGYIYASARSGAVRAFAAETGMRVWSVNLGFPISTGPVEGRDLLLLGGDAEVIALERATGALRWRAPVSSEVIAEPVRKDEMVIVRTGDGALYGFSATDGKQMWRNQDQQVPLLTLRGEGAPVVAGDVVFAGFANGRVAALGLRDGHTLWETPIAVARGRTELERLTDVDGRLIVTGEAVFAVGFQGRIVALSPENGRPLWGRELSSYQGIEASGTDLYVSDADGNLWSLAQSTGGTLWRQSALKGRSLGAPVIQGQSVVVGDYAGYLHWLSREDGRLLARVRVMTPMEAFPVKETFEDYRENTERRGVLAMPVVVGDLLFASDQRGALSAFRVKEKGTK